MVLKVPWKNLYKEAVEATLDGLYLLAVPNAEMEYDAEKEAKREREAKQAQIKAIEEQQLKNKKGWFTFSRSCIFMNLIKFCESIMISCFRMFARLIFMIFFIVHCKLVRLYNKIRLNSAGKICYLKF